MGLRSLEREVVKKSGTKSTFKERYNTYRTKKYGEGNVPRDTNKKKQVHFDSSKQYFNMIDFYMNNRVEKNEEDITANVTE